MSEKVKPKPKLTLPRGMLLATIFITGNVVMMLEVVGTRVVGPYFGVGIYVWSALITVTLLALAAGYWVGGTWADRYPQPEGLYLIILAAALFTLLIPLLRVPCLTMTGELGLRSGVMVGSVLLFGPALFLLGMVSPYATKLYTEQMEKLGTRVGLLYAISTLGSFIGTLSMGFYLIPNFRLTLILYSLGMVLLLLPLIYFLLLRSKKLWGFSLLLGILILATAILGQEPPVQKIKGNIKIVYKTTSFYGEIKVIETGSQRILLVDGVTQSGENALSHEATPHYALDMDKVIQRFQPQAKTVLVLGLGGGNMVHLLGQRGLDLDVVEIDYKIKVVAEKYFDVDPKRVTIHLNDGRRYVRSCPKQYDVVVLNTFNGESFPTHLLTREFFRELQRCLTPKGIVVCNFVGYVQGPHRMAAAAVLATFKSSFQWCHVYFREPKHRFANILFAAGNTPEVAAPTADEEWTQLQGYEVTISGWEKAPVCTDDYNPVEFLNRVVYKRWRQLVMDSLGPEILLD